MIPSWAHDVKPEDITNATMLDLAELLGTENMLTLVESYSGMIIYIPKLDSLLRNIRDRRIRQEYDGTNTRALALKYDVSESWGWTWRICTVWRTASAARTACAPCPAGKPGG